ncbi:hypothetical protein [Actinosynnema pretiosum]|uniref:hypothetical protein n=1 Tax=Actinosynnema pretiosum TaxID=42197 RepID=UPI001E413170|nr:hypothetical protein [Actinosynnema pretiosum]
MTDKVIAGLLPGNNSRRNHSGNPGGISGAPTDKAVSAEVGQSSPSASQRRILDKRRTPAPSVRELGPLSVRDRPRYALARFDDRGRLANRPLLALLRWVPRERLDIRLHGSSLVLQRNPEGVFALSRRGLIQIPLTVRRWWSFGTGDPVLLVAVPERAAMVIHSLAVLDKALHDPRQVVVASRPFDAEGTATGPGPARAQVDGSGVGAVGGAS